MNKKTILLSLAFLMSAHSAQARFMGVVKTSFGACIGAAGATLYHICNPSVIQNIRKNAADVFTDKNEEIDSTHNRTHDEPTDLPEDVCIKELTTLDDE